ncbi:MAG: ABC transporter ATP-binding protein [Bacillota bacterium]|nr:ABC transporter ATP-binding protein [Bacillota bacterium]
MINTQNQETLIEVKDLKIAYGKGVDSILAIDNVDLKIKRGEFLCVLGPSGCGKSTLLKAIAGYIQPTEGTCLMDGKPIVGPDWHRGVVFQSPTLYPWMSINDNVEFGPKMRGLPQREIDETREHFLEQVKLTGFGEKATFELSGGMKQRVALARVLANYPQVILMDEPLGALDALTRLNMQTLIREIWEDNNSTILFITHDIDEALSLGTRIAVMSKRPGKILKQFEVNFTDKIFEEKSKDIIYTEEYIKVKKEILKLINSQIED